MKSFINFMINTFSNKKYQADKKMIRENIEELEEMKVKQ